MKVYKPYAFAKATPVWKRGKEQERNTSLAVCATIAVGQTTLRVAGASVFTVTVNGNFVYYGPARAAHGFFRVSEIDLSAHLTKTENTVAIRAVGYNILTYSHPKNDAFVCAEIVAGGEVVAATGDNGFGFSYYEMPERVQRVHRYSYQRAFVENYRLSGVAAPKADVCNTAEKTFICHDLPYADGDCSHFTPISAGSVTYDGTPTYYNDENYYTHRAVTEVGREYDGYTRAELEDESQLDMGRMVFSKPAPFCGDGSDIRVDADRFVIAELERDYVGLFSFDLECDGDGELFFAFDEILLDTDRALDEFRLQCSNFIKWSFRKGTYRIVTAEPYTLKFLRIVAKGAGVRVRHLTLHRIEYPMSKITAKYTGGDPKMQAIFDAAAVTFASNATDVFMDCPSRERCAWSGDAFSTSRAEKALTGRADIQRAYLANHFEATWPLDGIPAGLLSGTYPADYYGDPGLTVGALFAVLWHLWEYYEFTHDDDMLAIAKDRLYQALATFQPYENQYGLVVDPPGALFFDWADCNLYTKGVSFLFNMYFYAGKMVLGKLYHDDEMIAQAEKTKQTILDYALDENGFIHDHALMIDGEMVVQPTYTETAQYYAFYYHILTKETHPNEWQRMIDKLGTAKLEHGYFPEMPTAGLYGYLKFRMELLSKAGERDELVDYIQDRCAYMVNRTGTIWEFVDDRASCNHGFTSAIAMYLKRVGLVE